MIFNIFSLLLGIALILWGADKLTDGACDMARRFNVSEMVIGLTVIAFGTSMPEFIVSFYSAILGVGNMSAGNIVGSNLFNTLVIVGASAMMVPMTVKKGTIWHDIPFSMIAGVVLMLLCMDTLLSGGKRDVLSRADGVVLMMFFAIFMSYTFSLARHKEKSKSEEEQSQDVELMPLWKVIALLVFGCGALVGGGEILVDSATEIALSLGVNEALIGLTICAAGTSLPELATSIVAARKGSVDMALGNAIGSNLFNVFFVLGACSCIRPLDVGGITMMDWGMLQLSSVLVWVFAFSRHRIGRVEGSIMALAYMAYLAFIVVKAI